MEKTHIIGLIIAILVLSASALYFLNYSGGGSWDDWDMIHTSSTINTEVWIITIDMAHKAWDDDNSGFPLEDVRCWLNDLNQSYVNEINGTYDDNNMVIFNDNNHDGFLNENDTFMININNPDYPIISDNKFTIVTDPNYGAFTIEFP